VTVLCVGSSTLGLQSPVTIPPNGIGIPVITEPSMRAEVFVPSSANSLN